MMFLKFPMYSSRVFPVASHWGRHTIKLIEKQIGMLEGVLAEAKNSGNHV
jgi:hypothetical protein